MTAEEVLHDELSDKEKIYEYITDKVNKELEDIYFDVGVVSALNDVLDFINKL